jgi:CspA family cold shock protein
MTNNEEVFMKFLKAIAVAASISCVAALAFANTVTSTVTSTGVVKYYYDSKGFGYITDDSTKKDVFVKNVNIVATSARTLQTGDKVKFNIRTTNGASPEAVNVVKY